MMYKYRISSSVGQKLHKGGSGVMQQHGAAHIAVTHWNDEYSKCPLLSHSCPFIHRRPLFQRSTLKTQLPGNKKGEIKIKRRRWMNGREGGRGQRVTTFFIPITFHHCTEHSYSSESQHYELNFFS